MKAIKLAALLIATTVATGMVVSDVQAYGGKGSSRSSKGYGGYGKGCSKSPAMAARSHTVRGPAVANMRERGADSPFGDNGNSGSGPFGR